jgi:dTDP-4-amino-4,6-dideoxygalactose transaminase
VEPAGDPTRDQIFFNDVALCRDELKAHLEANGVGCALHYPLPLYLQKCHASLGHKAGDFLNAEKSASQCLSLPIYLELTEAQIQRVVEVMKHFLRNKRAVNGGGQRPSRATCAWPR